MDLDPEPAPAVPHAPAARGATDDPDVALMLRVQGGEQPAFAELFQKFGPRVLHYVRRLVGHEARAEELTQDVFTQVFRARGRYRPESRFTTWLFTIATNVALNELRRPERQLRVDIWETRDGELPREGPPLPDDRAVTPEAGAASRELASHLEAAIRGLPKKQRAALLLSRIDGLAYVDVADALGCTEGAVKALIFRATQTLKAELRDFL